MSVHENTLQGLRETLEYAKGSLKLKSNVIEVSDEELAFYNVYGKLSEVDKVKLRTYANNLLFAKDA
ncbi:MAG: hypothetical protein FWG63_10355 [Defluviitaleaceae bacterium]|nr:hypothetical protein [Defluviitaleaceae bacterium]